MKGCASTADLQGTNRAQIQLSGGRLQIGMVAGIKSESPAGLNRNSHSSLILRDDKFTAFHEAEDGVVKFRELKSLSLEEIRI